MDSTSLTNYVISLETQLADAKKREKMLLRAINYYDGVRKEYADSCCRACFRLFAYFNVKRCQVCPKWKWKCQECAHEQQILTCGRCKSNICQSCDYTIISSSKEGEWVCLGCTWVENIKKKCAENLKLLKDGKITRTEAIVTCYYARFPRHDNFISFVYETLKLDDWFVFLADEDAELEQDFPEAEDKYDLVITPAYCESPNSIELAKMVARKFFPENASVWFCMLDNMSTEGYAMGRKTYSVKELVELRKECKEGGFALEQYEIADPEFLARIFD